MLMRLSAGSEAAKMIADRIPESIENTDIAISLDNNIIDGIIADLRIVIDQLNMNFANAKNLILELARRLDETKRFEQCEICRKIKDILHDKIKDGKISEKWIAECLPEEYKRKYSKRELCSLSKNAKKSEKIIIDNKGKTAVDVSATDSLSIDNNTNCIEPKGRNTKNIIQKKRSEELGALENENGSCIRCQELEEALRKTSIPVSAEYISINEIKLTIPKEKYEEVKDAMDNSTYFCNLIFDKRNGLLIAAKSDITGRLSNG